MFEEIGSVKDLPRSGRANVNEAAIELNTWRDLEYCFDILRATKGEGVHTKFTEATFSHGLAEKYRNNCLDWYRCLRRKALSQQSTELNTQLARKLQERQVYQNLSS
ncbi:hypothetical protein TNCV_916941 [Trichonephila clavipes]|nr:hypothetical protein TNCV_916941 [Trichonephila clavipes]